MLAFGLPPRSVARAKTVAAAAENVDPPSCVFDRVDGPAEKGEADPAHPARPSPTSGAPVDPRMNPAAPDCRNPLGSTPDGGTANAGYRVHPPVVETPWGSAPGGEYCFRDPDNRSSGRLSAAAATHTHPGTLPPTTALSSPSHAIQERHTIQECSPIKERPPFENAPRHSRTRKSSARPRLTPGPSPASSTSVGSRRRAGRPVRAPAPGLTRFR